MNRLALALATVLFAAAVLAAPAEARRAHCQLRFANGHQPIACQARTTVSPSDWWWSHLAQHHYGITNRT